MTTLTITSPDIPHLSTIPEEFTADGGGRTPRVQIAGVPDETVELALICHDPDAPLPHGFTHWTVYGIPPHTRALDVAAAGVRVGPNGWGRHEWFGPQPPPGHGTHHYYFAVYALDTHVDGDPTREAFLDAYRDAVIAQARFVGLFARP